MPHIKMHSAEEDPSASMRTKSRPQTLRLFLVCMVALAPAAGVRAQTSDTGSGVPDGAASNAAVQPSITTPQHGFLYHFAQAYWDDWKGVAGDSSEPARRGYPAPVSSPPFPFSDWPYGGSPTIGAPDSAGGPLMTALYSGENGKAWENSRIKIYGWVNAGFNVSTSDKHYGNAPAAYYIQPNSVQLDQTALYIERVPDTVQADHFDWGFRLTQLYGLDYRFTTANGYFSQQLLRENNKNGYDPVMAYVDLYWGQIAQGMNIRIGRYISLPDIEAQLAPDNYTYSHSILYTYDAYTQTGINATTRLNDHWMVQVGQSQETMSRPGLASLTPSPHLTPVSVTPGPAEKTTSTSATIPRILASTPTTISRLTTPPGITASGTLPGTPPPKPGTCGKRMCRT